VRLASRDVAVGLDLDAIRQTLVGLVVSTTQFLDQTHEILEVQLEACHSKILRWRGTSHLPLMILPKRVAQVSNPEVPILEEWRFINSHSIS